MFLVLVHAIKFLICGAIDVLPVVDAEAPVALTKIILFLSEKQPFTFAYVSSLASKGFPRLQYQIMPEKSRKTVAGSEPKHGDFLKKLYGFLPRKEICFAQSIW